MLASLSVRWKIIDKNANAWEVFPYFPTWKGIRILKSEEVLLVESAIPEFFSRGFHNPGLRNPEYSSRDPESTNDLECGIEVVPANNPESGAHNQVWATPVLGVCHGVLRTSLFYFRHILGHFFPAKMKLHHTRLWAHSRVCSCILYTGIKK